MEIKKTLTDDELVQMYADGNNEAFDTLLERYRSKLYTYILITVRDEDLANDLFQETFVKVIVSIRDGKYRCAGKFGAWIMRIAHNLIMDSYRSNTSDQFISADDPDAGLSLSDTGTLPSREDELIYAQTLDDVTRFCALLPEAQQQVVYLRYQQGMSFKEIADQLDISINTALGRMRYALLGMRRMMAHGRNAHA